MGRRRRSKREKHGIRVQCALEICGSLCGLTTFRVSQLLEFFSAGVEVGSWRRRRNDVAGVLGVLVEGVVEPEEFLVQPVHRELRLGELGHGRLCVDSEFDPVPLGEGVRDVHTEMSFTFVEVHGGRRGRVHLDGGGGEGLARSIDRITKKPLFSRRWRLHKNRTITMKIRPLHLRFLFYRTG